MNQEKTVKFCLTEKGEGVNVEIEGRARDLTNLLATVISESEEIEMVITMALLAVKMKQDEGNSEDLLAKMMSAIKPVAQA